jgi:hypothetical protein
MFEHKIIINNNDFSSSDLDNHQHNQQQQHAVALPIFEVTKQISNFLFARELTEVSRHF